MENDELTVIVTGLRNELDELKNESMQLRIDLSTAMMAIDTMENFLDISCGNKPHMESGKLSWEVINLKIKVEDMEKQWFGKNIDAMANI